MMAQKPKPPDQAPKPPPPPPGMMAAQTDPDVRHHPRPPRPSPDLRDVVADQGRLIASLSIALDQALRLIGRHDHGHNGNGEDDE